MLKVGLKLGKSRNSTPGHLYIYCVKFNAGNCEKASVVAFSYLRNGETR